MKQISVEGAGLHVDREMTWLSPGLVRMRQIYRVPERYAGALVTGPQWLFSLVSVSHGTATFLAGSRTIVAPREFSLFIPAFTVVRFDWSQCEVIANGLLGDAHICESRVAVIRNVPALPEPRTAGEVQSLLQGTEPVAVSEQPDPDSIAARAREILDRHHDEKITIDEVATALGVSPSVLSRTFSDQFGVGPLEYRHRVQIMDAIMRLSTGETITAAAFDAGFADLSRFYKQFAKYARAAPSKYRDVAAPGASSLEA